MGCIEKLDVVYNFIQLCIKSEEYRKAQLELQIKDAKFTQEIKEEIFASFTCYICSKSFRLKRTLSLHITRIHLNPKKNVKRKSGKESKSDHNTDNIKNEVKTEEEDKKHLQSLIIFDTENKNQTKEEIKSDKTFSDSENNVYDYSSSEELLSHKEKKPYKGQKRDFSKPYSETRQAMKYIQYIRKQDVENRYFFSLVVSINPVNK
ncbi:unnamed protein product [Ceutorhynchus assimilis]|uniref:C2H2-type domain-containing protein n=1 Tax=Ceutorhynchus assimilis TaxID=467358 RepID=A0A9N9MTT3_9CUCU|nr:unnamed protein product [Ceutorhynchus assimilis]